MRKQNIILAAVVLAIAMLAGACGSHRKGCDGRSKTRVDMGWM